MCLKDEIDFFENYICINCRYEFKHSSISVDGKIDAVQIERVDLRGYKSRFIVNGNEVIFIDVKYNDALKAFCIKNNVRIDCIYDIWEDLFYLIGDKDNDYSRVLRLLLKIGFSEKEINLFVYDFKSTLKKSDELGEMDIYQLLKYTFFLTREKYLKIMSITIRAHKAYLNHFDTNQGKKRDEETGLYYHGAR